MPGRFVGQRRALHARHTGDAAGALAVGNGRAEPPLCGRRGLLGLRADTLPRLQARRPQTVADIGLSLSGAISPIAAQAPSTVALAEAASHLQCRGFTAPPWDILVGGGGRPAQAQRGLWWAASHHRPAHSSRILRAPPCQCRCGGRLDPLGDHRAACPTAGVLGVRGAPLRAAARMCREAGARVATNVFLRDMNVGLPLAESRRIDVLANGLPLWHGAQVAVDTTLVCPLTRSGEPRQGAEREPGLALQTAANRKRRVVYQNFSPRGGANLQFWALRWAGESGRKRLDLSAS